jgi:hypothetical protein
MDSVISSILLRSLSRFLNFSSSPPLFADGGKIVEIAGKSVGIIIGCFVRKMGSFFIQVYK